LKGSGTDAGADGIRINHDPVRQVRRRRRHIGVTIAQQSCACLRRWHPRQQQVAGERAGWAQRVGTEKPPRDFLARCCATLEELRGTGHETGNEAAAWRCTLLALSVMRCSRENCCHWRLFRDGGAEGSYWARTSPSRNTCNVVHPAVCQHIPIARQPTRLQESRRMRPPS
jgi:hypothetical protein